MSSINFRQKILCRNCTENIFTIHTVLIRCASCPDFDLCPDCFAAGASLGEHIPSHPYRVIDNGGFALLGSSWTAREHIELLDSVEQYGYGNWGDITRQTAKSGPIGSVLRSSDESKNEFGSIFINGPIGQYSWKEDHRGQAKDHTKAYTITSPVKEEKIQQPEIGFHETIMLGYMPFREDYEVEHENEAETLVSQFQSYQIASGPNASAISEDEEVDLALQASHVDMYKYKLKEREYRKKVVKDHQLIVHYFKENPLEYENSRRSFMNSKSKRLDANRLDVCERLKLSARFLDINEFRKFMTNVSRERELKNRIKELLRFRKNGVTLLKDSTEYEVQRLRRIKRRHDLRKKFNNIQDNGSPLSGINSPFRNDEFANSPLNVYSPSKPLMEEKMNSIIGLPGFEVLSQNERKLCSSLKLAPAHYVSYKTCLLTNHLQKKKGQTPKPLNPHGLDKNNRKIILQFLIRSGWLAAY